MPRFNFLIVNVYQKLLISWHSAANLICVAPWECLFLGFDCPWLVGVMVYMMSLNFLHWCLDGVGVFVVVVEVVWCVSVRNFFPASTSLFFQCPLESSLGECGGVFFLLIKSNLFGLHSFWIFVLVFMGSELWFIVLCFVLVCSCLLIN